MCVSKCERHGSFFPLEVSEIGEEISLKMGATFAASFNISRNLFGVLSREYCT